MEVDLATVWALSSRPAWQMLLRGLWPTTTYLKVVCFSSFFSFRDGIAYKLEIQSPQKNIYKHTHICVCVYIYVLMILIN